ncbi:MAG: hypothetical protein ACTSYB_13355 [Candidatus Helarchaeota archaeon]
MVDYQKEKQNLEKIAEYFDKMNISYDFTDEFTDSNEKFPLLITIYTYRNLHFGLHVINNDDWICAKAMVLDTAMLDPSVIHEIYQICLELNFQLPETTYSANEGQIFVEADMPVGVSFEDFKREIMSIGRGIDILIDALFPLGVNLKEATESHEEKTPPKEETKKSRAKKKTSKKKKAK